MSPDAYFWKGGELIEYFGSTSVAKIPEEYLDMYCVDTSPIYRDRKDQQSGIYRKAKDANMNHRVWKPTPISELPPEFRLALLISGVSL